MSKRRRPTFGISAKVIKPDTLPKHVAAKNFKPLCGRITSLTKVCEALVRFIHSLGDWSEVHIIIRKEEGGGEEKD